MGKITGFLDYERRTNPSAAPAERIKHYNEFHPLLPRAARQEQAARCMDCGVPFCQSGMPMGGAVSGCPLHNLIPEWNDMLYRGNLEQALQRLLRTSNFPEFTGRVCPALCEAACTCSLNGQAVTTKENELDIIESAFNAGLMKPKPPKIRTGKTVAVVGSGPSGLAVADQLNRRGHSVTVFEREDRVGGLLMYGIPNMKLEKFVVERRVSLMALEGVTFRTGVNVGVDLTAEELKSDFDAVVLCCGASQPRDLNVKGRDAKGVYFAVDYLKATTRSLLNSGLADGNFPSAEGKNVIIIGGGDTGNDCVGTAIRQGCKSVIQLEMMPKPSECRRENNPWPEWPFILKTDYGQEEAIALFGRDPRIYQTTVKELISDETGHLSRVRTIKLEPKTRDGRTVMEEIPGSEELLDCQLLLIAAGFLGSEAAVCKAFDVERDGRTNVKTEPGRYLTSAEKVFTAGDMHRGQSLVVWAVTEGRGAAREVDEFLMGYTNLN